MEQLVMSVEEVARAIGVCRSKVYGMIADGQLRGIRFGRSVRVPVSAVRELVDSKVGVADGTLENS